MSKEKSVFAKIGTGALGLGLLLAAIGATTLILSNLRLRADLTADRLYTLSDGSRAVLGQLDKDVTLKFYFSASAPNAPQALKNYARQVEDLLKEYRLAGQGRLTLESYDPQPDSDYEEWAQRYGLEPQQTDLYSAPIYFGLVAVGPNGEEQAIRVFSPQTEATLEYDITRLVTRVAWPEKPVLGVMSSLTGLLGAPMNPMMMGRRQPQDQGWAVFQELKKDYAVREVAADAKSIDADIKALVVVHPKGLSDETLYAIDQFVLRGGRLIACVDPFSVTDMIASQQQQNPMMQQMGGGQGPSTLGKLFDAWGVGFDTAKIVADVRAATKLGGGPGGRAEENPAFLSLTASNVNKDDLLTAQFSMVMLPFAGAVVNNAQKDIAFTPLLSSSADGSCLIDAMNVQFGMGAMRSQLNPDKTGRALAARLKGTFKSAFPDGFTREGETNAVPGHLASGTGTMIVFGDSDFLADQFSVQQQNFFGTTILQPMNDNLALFFNAVEQSAGRDELIGIRSRGKFNRPFAKVDNLEYKAMLKWKTEEERLQASLQETQRRLQELQQQKQGAQRLILSAEQQEQIARFREEQARTSKQLKTVRKSLNRDIERLGFTLKTLNIAAVPLLVIVVGLVRGLNRRRRH